MTFYHPFSDDQKLKLKFEYSKLMDSCIFVHCKKINGSQIEYECPFCCKVGREIKSKFKKNGEKYSRFSPVYHVHGSGFDNSNRVESRISHCLLAKSGYNSSVCVADQVLEEADKLVVIVTDDDTVRFNTDDELKTMEEEYHERKIRRNMRE